MQEQSQRTLYSFVQLYNIYHYIYIFFILMNRQSAVT